MSSPFQAKLDEHDLLVVPAGFVLDSDKQAVYWRAGAMSALRLSPVGDQELQIQDTRGTNLVVPWEVAYKSVRALAQPIFEPALYVVLAALGPVLLSIELDGEPAQLYVTGRALSEGGFLCTIRTESYQSRRVIPVSVFETPARLEVQVDGARQNPGRIYL